MINRDDVYNIFDSDTRIVLIEKAPFLIKHVPVSLLSNKSLYFMVRRINKLELEKRANSLVKNSKNIYMNTYRIVDYGLKDYPENEEYQIGAFVLRKDFEILGTYTQLKNL